MTNRNTIQCALVLDTVKSLCCHATADEVYETVRKDYPNISRGTVYRNLNRLSDSGQIRKVSVLDGADRFDHRCEEHYHIKCEECGRIFDVDMEVISNINQRVKDTHGFKFDGCEIMFRGVCPECQQLKKEDIRKL